MKNIGYLFFVLSLISVLGYSQTNSPNIDSLIKKAIESGSKNIDSAIYYTESAYKLAQTTQDTVIIGSVAYYYSYYLISNGKYDKAQSLLDYNFENKDKLTHVLVGNSHYNQAAMFDIGENYDEALEHYFYSVDYYKQANSIKGLSKSYLQIGVIYEKLNKLKMADYFFDASLEVSGNDDKKHKADSSKRGMTPYQKTATSLLMLKELKNGSNKKLKSIVYYNLGQSLMEEFRFNEAVDYFIKSIQIKEDINFLTNLDKSYFLLGKCYYHINQPEKAIANLKKAKNKNIKRSQAADIEALLSRSFEQKGEYKAALLHSNVFKKISDSIASDLQNERITEITAKYNNQKQTNELISLQQENQNKALEIAKQENLRWRWFIVALVATLIAVWMGRRLIKSRERVKEIELEKAHIAKKVEEIAVILNNKTKIYLKQLKYIKSDGNYLEFITDEKRIIDRNKIKAILEELPPNFVKVHRSYIINKNYVSSVNRSNVILRPDIIIPLSRTFKNNLNI
ncbi:LytTR family transcriptional regulator DNA-binding domain-containing protein [Winogradskyella ouciana]|uniref:Tetratricopeptide repeat protein n=1 Tax=Winogradskyella ouciana TaxID=2608631 RepID=A0A7K1GCW9_9FLAO|nr:LytTR family transcriptional regulator DNA-binding domain-containing protein [Winogradskyella ouciana]MTE27152.1 tetratricopeptide repeat protein [Winogradskyella ouciana]